MKNKIAPTRIGEIKNAINKFGEENKMNRKLLLGACFFIVFLFGTSSILYSITYFILFIGISLKPVRLFILDIVTIIQPGLYFLVKKYIPYLSSLRGLTEDIYNGLGVLFLILFGYLLIKHNDDFLLSLYYQKEIEKKVLDPFIAWTIFACGYLMLGNLKTIFYLIKNFILSWTFLASSILILILLKIENSDYFNTLIIYFPLLLAIIVQYKIYDTEINNKNYAQYKLYFNESAGKWTKYLGLIRHQSEGKLGNISAISDNPISYKSEDIFGYKDIADNTYNLIKGINVNSGSYSIGVIGEWGLGKSSIVGMLKESRLKLDSSIILHEFNPWNFTKSDLIYSFITEIASKVNKKDLTKLLIKYTELLSGVNSTAGAIIKLVKTLFGNEKTIDEIRKEVGEELGKTNKKLVVIIDDLDRCEPEEIITMLNVVKNIGNFSHVIYLISFDKIHIIEALKTKGFHEDYIEKIINTEIYINTPLKEKKVEFFKKEFNKILNEISINENIRSDSIRLITESGNMGLDEIFEKENLRFIKKLLNKLNVSLKLRFNKEQIKTSNLVSLDIANIVLINYIQIKDITFYNESISKKLLNSESLAYRTPNRPSLFLNLQEKILHERFLTSILGIWVTLNTDTDILYIGNSSFSKDSTILTRIEHNWKLLTDFS